MTTKLKIAINNIVTANTLPPQIDYTDPYLAKAHTAQQYINSLSHTQREQANTEIQNQIEAYYTPNIPGEDGMFYSVAALDSMF